MKLENCRWQVRQFKTDNFHKSNCFCKLAPYLELPEIISFFRNTVSSREENWPVVCWNKSVLDKKKSDWTATGSSNIFSEISFAFPQKHVDIYNVVGYTFSFPGILSIFFCSWLNLDIHLLSFVFNLFVVGDWYWWLDLHHLFLLETHHHTY